MRAIKVYKSGFNGLWIVGEVFDHGKTIPWHIVDGIKEEALKELITKGYIQELGDGFLVETEDLK